MELQKVLSTSIYWVRLAAEMGVLFMEKSLQAMTRQNNLAIWTERVQACRSSGLPVKTWCAENGIVPNTYFRWQKKVFDVASTEQGQFYEVPICHVKNATENACCVSSQYWKNSSSGQKRIVIGCSGAAWYTNNHYNSFIAMDR